MKANTKALIAFLLSLLLISMFRINIRPIIFLIVFSALNALILTYDRYITAPLDLELSTFCAVVFTVKYGLMWGVAAAIITKFSDMIYNKNIDLEDFASMLGYVIAVFVSNILHNFTGNIITIGLIAIVVTNIFGFLMSMYVTMISRYEMIMYAASNIAINFIMFVGFSWIIIWIMDFNIGLPFL
jgi:hypothetical protein